jgi:hypothetical protein
MELQNIKNIQCSVRDYIYQLFMHHFLIKAVINPGLKPANSDILTFYFRNKKKVIKLAIENLFDQDAVIGSLLQ